MWIGVTPRFSAFDFALALTPSVKSDGETKCTAILQSINRHYFGVSEAGQRGLIVGSWGKGTAKNPASDVDLFYLLTKDIFDRFDQHQHNGQSALLQDVRDALLNTYPQTTIRGDGQVVVVAFNSLVIEVAPAYRPPGGAYLIPNANNGGSWRASDPQAEYNSLELCDITCNRNCRRLVRMMKAWRDHCNVPIKSFHIELLMAEFLPNSEWRNQDYFYYDWLARDFLKFLTQSSNRTLFAPGTYEIMSLGDAWLSKAQSAHARAVKACDYEREDLVVSAGEEWQKIFGGQVPLLR